MSVNIAPKISLPEGTTLREGVEIRLTFEVDLINHENRDFGLTIELWNDGVMGSPLIIGGTVHDLPFFDDQALITLRVAQRAPNRKVFDAVLMTTADWYSRHREFTLRRGAPGTEDDHVVFEMREKDRPGSEVHSTDPLHREWAQKYFLFP